MDVLTFPSRPLISTEPSPASPRQIRRSITLSSSLDSWPDAVEFIESELRRGREGFTQAEIDEAIAVELTDAQNRIPNAAKQSRRFACSRDCRTDRG